MWIPNGWSLNVIQFSLVIVKMAHIFNDVVSNIIPAVYSASDTIMTYNKSRTYTVAYYMNIVKFVFTALLLMYLYYLYYVKKQSRRIADIFTEIVILTVTFAFVCVTLYYSYFSMLNEIKENKTKQIAQRATEFI